MPSSSEDMTACFGALDVKTIPQRMFSCYPNRPQLAASAYCHHEGGEGGEGGLARTPLMDSLQPLCREENDQTAVGKMIPDDFFH